MKYSEKDIQALDGIGHIRHRPGMYVGGTDLRALHIWLDILLEDSAKESAFGRSDRIYIELRDNDEIFFADNGPGLPVDAIAGTEKTKFEHIMETNVVPFPRLSEERMTVMQGLHSLGFSTVNALSSQFMVESIRDGYLWRQTYQEGRPQSPLEKIRESTPGDKFSLMITFRPDFSIFEENPINLDKLVIRCNDVAYTCKNLTIDLVDKRGGAQDEIIIHKPNGIENMVVDRCEGYKLIGEPFRAEKSIELSLDNPERKYTVSVEVALQFNNSEETSFHGYVNTIHTSDGGTHVRAAKSSIMDALQMFTSSSYWLYSKKMSPWDDTPLGFQAAVNVAHPDPMFESQTRVKLMNPEIHAPIAAFIYESFKAYLKSGKPDYESWKALMRR